MTDARLHAVSEEEHGSRLDAFVSRVLACGIRGAKRRILEGGVLVNGRSSPPQCKLKAGSVVAIGREEAADPPPPPVMAAAGGEYAAFVKPAGLHTARITGSTEPSLEQSLAAHWPFVRIAANTGNVPSGLPNFPGDPFPEEGAFPETLPPETPILLSRLDFATSGLVAATFTTIGEQRFRALEVAGKVDKYYLALVHGVVPEPFCLTNALDTDTRKKTRVLAERSPDPARHTEIVPMPESFPVPESGATDATTLVTVHIKRGARHQIRAHLAHAGFPIVGDALYGKAEEPTPLFLHHARLQLPGFSAFHLPGWLSLP